MQKKLLSWALVAVFLLIIAGCASKPATTNTTKLKIGTEATYPPFEFRNEKNEIIGFDMDLAQELAKELNVEIEVVDMAFDGLIPALDAKKIDIIMAGLQWNPDRAERLGLSEIYAKVPVYWVTRKDSDIKSKEDVKDKVIATQLGTTMADLANAAADEYGAEVRSFQKYLDVFLEIENGRADIAPVALTTYLGYEEQVPNLKLNFVEEGGYTNDKVIGVRKGDEKLLADINNALKKLEETGRLKEMKKTWFGDLDI